MAKEIIKNILKSPKVANPTSDDDYYFYHPETELDQVVGAVKTVGGEKPDANGNIATVMKVNGSQGDVTVTCSPTYPLKVLADGHTANALIVGQGNADSVAGNGIDIGLGSGGCVAIGSGESVANSGLVGGGTENLYLMADGTVYIYPNCQTYANHVAFAFTTDGKLQFPNGTIWLE